ncbi:hypothetical protein ACIRF8_15340 [Streptomyces sp. NPDC102406]|uniref:hypothetical protein n=1 Tax=Streptomyces sp. NPDC102406 TaxID=3366171 RepID=UPI00382D7F19
MAKWDHIRNEPVSVENTRDELAKLSEAAQKAELTGQTVLARALHREINSELDELDQLKRS